MFLELWNRADAVIRRRRLDRELDAEMRFHLAMQIDVNIRSGLSADEARRTALIAFGGIAQTAEACRETRLTWLDSLWQDARYAARAIRRRPALAASAASLLGIAIGVSAAMFTIVDALILRPAPFKDPEQLALVWMRDDHGGPTAVAPEVYRAWRQSPAFTSAEAAMSDTAILGTDPDVVARPVASVTPGVFDLLGGVRPVLGRLFDASEGRPGADDRVLLSEDLWRAQYHADPLLVGRRIMVDGKPMVVIGVLPSDFRFPSWNTAIWKPVSFDSPASDAIGWPVVYVRFAPNVPRRDALQIATRAAKEAHVSNATRWAQPEPLAGLVLDAYSQRAVPVLLGCVLLLFIALCANVSGLLLGGLAARAHEFRTRTALGAPRSRLVRLALLESVGIGVAGLVGGLALGWMLVAIAREVMPDAFLMSSLNPLHVDVRTLLVTCSAGLVATLGAGLLPAIVATRGNGGGSLLPSEQVAPETTNTRRIARVLLIGQIALSCTLLLAATLLARSFVNLATKDRGLDATNVMVATVEMPKGSAAAPSTGSGRAVVARALEEQVRSLPGIARVAWSYGVPPDACSVSFGDWLADTPVARPVHLEVNRMTVGPDFLELYGIKVLRGRSFIMSDEPGAVLVGERFARALWPGTDPVGRTFSFQSEQFHVVGLVREIYYPSLQTRLDRPQFYERFETPPHYATLSVRCGGGPQGSCLDPTLLRHRLTAGHPAIKVFRAAGLEDAYAKELARPRAAAALALSFASTALAAAAAGLFTVLSHSVARRRRELGIRAALGASPADARRQVLREGTSIALPGIVLGIAGGLLLSRALASLQYGVTMTDPVSWAVIVTVLALTIAGASWYPTRDAARTDPAVWLREA